MSPWLIYHWFKLLEHHAMTPKEPVSAFPYLSTSTNAAFKIFVQCPKSAIVYGNGPTVGKQMAYFNMYK